MILVIGGAYQGKYNFVKKELQTADDRIYNDFHIHIKYCIEQNHNVDSLINSIFSSNIEVIISDEIGCGIIPGERINRDWREETGRALCKIAERCTQVWRIHCGIGIKIKG
ncbi:MAG: bifunctional adenosylcobinamide kinase/adenosylcobinamide-phosphate guanylyltransferase [Clostridia bacterium]|nr:bifunctional adenosylcobinamide kinase/adenosylcobinamide-phosphate guanylyltransferase [Clostridia bacterium]